MTATKYSITEGNNVTEFATLGEAEAYKTANSLSADIVTIEYEVPDEETPIEIPDVTPRQIRQALILSGVSLESITDALATLPEPQKSLATVEWEYSISFQRNRPLVDGVGQMLGWTTEQLDNLWLYAGTL